MSRDIEDLRDVIEQSGRESYLSGDPFYTEFPTEIVKEFLSISFETLDELKEKSDELVSGYSLETRESIYGQLLLDCVLSRLLSEALCSNHAVTSYLFTPLIEALHSAGENDFIINFTGLPNQYNTGAYTTGREGGLLSCRYVFRDIHKSPGVADTITFGMLAEHAALSTEQGVWYLGTNAESCTFSCDYAKVIGVEAENSTFYVQQVIKDMMPAMEHLIDTRPKDRSYQIHCGRDDEQSPINVWVQRTFWDKNNRLFMLDDDGEWEEVFPE